MMCMQRHNVMRETVTHHDKTVKHAHLIRLTTLYKTLYVGSLFLCSMISCKRREMTKIFNCLCRLFYYVICNNISLCCLTN